MKRILCLLLMVCCLATCFVACSKEAPPDNPVTDVVTNESEVPATPDIEYTDVLELMNGDLLGKSDSECGLPEESLFLTGDNVVGYDYVCIGDVIGNMTFYLKDGLVTSYVFGSAPYSTVDEFSTAFDTMNGSVSDCIGTDVKASAFHGGSSDEDAMESLFAGKGVMTAEYVTDDYVVTVTGCGVNGVATLVVECKAVGTEG